ncbi:hypothetical protein NC653_011798 [Populus alba x Populus x berolinensis]|uniref:Uncharacterized protein n=1 Tax=Populus alba x Populus x berolinensis TaxID=444605 RepID=A0AAD6W7E2_9ROSI|nr:hypothetical protein NC653_011798 [Populus alba x Populus x berolinensis]
MINVKLDTRALVGNIFNCFNFVPLGLGMALFVSKTTAGSFLIQPITINTIRSF